jgi:mannosyltransferase
MTSSVQPCADQLPATELPAVSAERTRSSVRNSLLLPGAIVFCGLFLRLWGLGQKSLWLDEIWSLTVARMPLQSVIWSIRNQDPNASLYYLLLHYWIALGQSEFMIRLMSALAGTVTIAVLYILGEHLFNRRVGLIASALLAINLYHIQYSQEARSYSLVVLLVTISSLLFAKLIEKPVLKNLAPYVLVSALAVYAHVFAVLVIAAQCGSVFLLQTRQVAWKRITAGMLGTGILVVPAAALLYQRTQAPFVKLSWVPPPTLRRVYDLFYALAGNASYFGIEVGKAPGAKVLLLIYFGTCVLGALFAISVLRSSGRSLGTWKVGLLFSWAFVPITLNLIVSSGHQSMFLSRYMLICSPALSLIAALGIDQIKKRYVATGSLVLIFGIQIAGIPQYQAYRSGYTEWKAATDYMLASGRRGDGAIFALAHGRLLFDYYDEQYHHGIRPNFEVVYPDLKNETTDPMALSYFPIVKDGLIESLGSKYERVWLVLYPDDTAPMNEVSLRMSQGLAAQYSRVEEAKIDQVILRIYSGRRTGGAVAEQPVVF